MFGSVSTPIRSHSSGAGKVFDPLLAGPLWWRGSTACAGFSGVHPELVELLVTLIMRYVPVLDGGVGDSGDLCNWHIWVLC